MKLSVKVALLTSSTRYLFLVRPYNQARNPLLRVDHSREVMIAMPHSSFTIFHGEQDKVVYTLQGYGTAVSERERSARQGHQEVNDRDNEVTWIITRAG